MDIRIHVDMPAIERLAEAIEHSSMRWAAPIQQTNIAPFPGVSVTPATVGRPQSDSTEKVVDSMAAPEKTEIERSATPTGRDSGFTEVPVETVPVELTASADDTPPWETAGKPAEEAAPAITLERILKTTAQMRDDGLMPQLRSIIGVKGPYGIRMVSQLKPDQYEAFAADLRRLGGKI